MEAGKSIRARQNKKGTHLRSSNRGIYFLHAKLRTWKAHVFHIHHYGSRHRLSRILISTLGPIYDQLFGNEDRTNNKLIQVDLERAGNVCYGDCVVV